MCESINVVLMIVRSGLSESLRTAAITLGAICSYPVSTSNML